MEIISVETTKITVSVENETLKAYAKGDQLILTNKALSKLPHDLICWKLFGGEAGKNLADIYPMGTISDVLTPDHIHVSETSVVVKEIKTTFYEGLMEGRLNEAIHLYREECLERARAVGKTLKFTVIVAGFNKVVVSGDEIITEKEKDEIRALYTLGMQVKNLAEQEGWSYEETTEDTEDWKAMMDGIAEMVLPSQSILPLMSNTHLEKWKAVKPDQNWLSVQKKLNRHASKIDHDLIDMYNSGEEDVIIKNAKIQEKIIDDYWEEHDAHHNTERSDCKAPVQLPYLVVKKRTDDDLREHHASVKVLQSLFVPEDSLSNLWHMSSIDAGDNIERFLPVNESSCSKNQRFRVRPRIPESDKHELALSGIEAKKYSKDELLKEMLDKTHKGFKSTTNTDDITFFVSANTLSKIDSQINERDENLQGLIKKAMELSQTDFRFPEYSNDHFKLLKDFLTTEIGLAMEFINSLAEEVNISRSQHTRKGHFILKKMISFNAYLLIKSTTPDGPIFFSVLVCDEDLISHRDIPFKTMKKYGNVWISEFVSMNKHVVSHCLFMREKAFCLLSMWMHLYSITPGEFFLQPMNTELLRHFNLSLLVWLEGKEQTSKELQQVRYGYMEIIRHNYDEFCPLKIMKKWDCFSRSRLLLWCRKRIVECFQKTKLSKVITSDMPTNETAFHKSLDKCKGIYSWVTLNEVDKFEIALNLSYLGALHNKEHSVEMHGMLKVFSKVAKEEIKMRRARPEKMGEESSQLEDLRDHEFSLDFTTAMGDCVKEYMVDKFGVCEERILSRFKHRILSRDLLELSTLKKSACGDLQREHHDPAERENERRTCLEASLLFLRTEKEVRPMKKIGKLCKEVNEEYGGIMTNLFKKLQIGGIREIFVLEFRCRIILHFMETLSRVVCEDIDMEMLTKGDKKLSRSDQHFFEVRRLTKQNMAADTVINSDDATTWAQRFVMPAFASFLVRFMPEEFHEAILYILNMVTNKKLEFPSSLLKLYNEKPEIVSTDPAMQEVKEQFLGLSDKNDLLGVGCRMFKNRSNMMQGILHYTSSLYHCGYMLMIEKYANKFVTFKMQKHFPDTRYHYIITSKVSSDDSSLLQTLMYPDPETDTHLKHYLCVISKLKALVYPYTCAEHSIPKSTTSTLSGVEEFNSLWYYKNTLMSPIIKFIASALKVHTNTRMSDRFNSLANLRKDVLEHGGSVGLCYLVMLAQCICHYKTLGLTVNTSWSKYYEMLISKPHPQLGFFLFEHPVLCGMFGQDMSYYLACSSKQFRALHLGLYKRVDMEFDELGQPSFRTYLSFGQSKKYFQMKARLDINVKNIRSDYIEKPRLLYERPMTYEDSHLALMHKACNPILAEAMDFSNDAKMHAASVYILQEPVILVSEGSEAEHDRVSLIELFKKIKPDEDAKDYKWLFPLHTAYDEVLQEIKRYKMENIIIKANRRSVATNVRFTTVAMKSPITLLNLVRRRWFKMPTVHGSRYSHDVSWEWFKSLSGLSWLRDTHDETLENSPFPDAMSLYNYISSMTMREKVVRAFCPSEVSASNMQAAASMIKHCQWRGRVLTMEKEDLVESHQSEIRKIAEKIWRISAMPDVPERVEVLKHVLSNAPDFLSSLKPLSANHKLTRGHISLGILISYVRSAAKTGKEMEILSKFIESANVGVVGSFEVRQRRGEDGKYYGNAVYKGRFDGKKLEIRVKDSTITNILANSVEDVKHSAYCLKTFIKEQGWEADYEENESPIPHLDYKKNKIVWRSGACRIPITITELRWDVRLTDGRLFIEITPYASVRLVSVDSKYLDIEGKYTVLSFRVNRSDLGSNETLIGQVSNDPLWDHWIRSAPLPPEDLIRHLGRSKKREAWGSKMIRERCNGKYGYTISLPRIIDPDEFDTNSSSSEDVEDKKIDLKLTGGFVSASEIEEAMGFEGSDTDSKESVEGRPMDEVGWLDIMEEEGLIGDRREDLKMMLNDDPGFTNLLFDPLLDHFMEINSKNLYRFLASQSPFLIEAYRKTRDHEEDYTRFLQKK